MLYLMKNRGFDMSVIFMEGLDQFGGAEGQKIEIEAVDSCASLRLSYKGASVSYDVSPPADGKWHTVSVRLLQTPEGIFYVHGSPSID